MRRSTQAATKKQKPIENWEQVRRSNFNYIGWQKEKISKSCSFIWNIYGKTGMCKSIQKCSIKSWNFYDSTVQYIYICMHCYRLSIIKYEI